MRSLSKGAPLFASEDSKTISFLRIRTAREKCREVNRVWVLDLLLGRSWASNQSIVVDRSYIFNVNSMCLALFIWLDSF